MCYGAATVPRDDGDAGENTGTGGHGRARDGNAIAAISRTPQTMSQRIGLSLMEALTLKVALPFAVIGLDHFQTNAGSSFAMSRPRT